MYCCHCGKEINENKLEDQKMSQTLHEGEIDESTEIQYVCPRCGHLIHRNVSDQEIKTLAAASHAEIQKSRNFFANGMSAVCIGLILLILGIIFFTLAKKPANNFELVTTCPEFFVSLVGLSVGAASFLVGAVLTLIGFINGQKYKKLLKQIQNDVFHQ